MFLPRPISARRNAAAQIVETEILNFGYAIYGWRQVPINVACIGEKANATRPEIEQIMICERRRASSDDEFERELYIIRRRIEKPAIAAQIPEFYVCSLSCRSIIYKGMFLAEQPDRLLSRPARRALRLALRHLPPALFDQHLPDLAAGAAVPHARP